MLALFDAPVAPPPTSGGKKGLINKTKVATPFQINNYHLDVFLVRKK